MNPDNAKRKGLKAEALAEAREAAIHLWQRKHPDEWSIEELERLFLAGFSEGEARGYSAGFRRGTEASAEFVETNVYAISNPFWLECCQKSATKLRKLAVEMWAKGIRQLASDKSSADAQPAASETSGFAAKQEQDERT